MKTILLFSALVIANFLFAQQTNLYISKPVQEAYKNGTRSFDGMPGDNYWKNRSNYQINVNVDPIKKELNGSLIVTYYNESPDTLDEIVMRLYQDFYKKGMNRDFQISPEVVHDGVDIKKVKVRGKELDASVGGKDVVRSGTNMFINLEEPLNPSENISIEVDWSFEIQTKSTVRMGAYSDTSMFVAYWYPQVAVYDDIDGWDKLDYSGLTEMYNDFSNYEVEITAPKNYIVWGTGELQNSEEILQPEYLMRYSLAQNSDTTVNILGDNDKNKNITLGESSTWYYKANRTPDFAFALGKNYLWDASTVYLQNGKKVFVDAGYKRDVKHFDKVEYILNKSVRFFSEKMPGVPFPFPTVTVFNGSGGMEFPMMINDGETSVYERTVGLTLHELAHTYFPFYLGTNERRYAFMDEGWAVFLPVMQQIELGEILPMERRYNRYHNQARTITAVPPMVPSYALDRTSYRMTSYTRAGAAYFSLQAQLGKETFLEALQEFIDRWNGKHPTPYDFFFTFEEISGQDLKWFWNKWFFDFAIAEMHLSDYKIEDGRKTVKITNTGGLPLPVVLTVYFKDHTEELIIKKPEVWKNDAEELFVNLNTDKKITMITLGHDFYPNISEQTKLNINE